MARATVELDFFGMEKSRFSSNNKFLHRHRSFRDIQSAISKINPDLLRSVIASGSANQQSSETGSSVASSTPEQEQTQFPVFSPLPMPKPALDNQNQTAPLTIFYNGTVAVFDLPPHEAETILKLAQSGISKHVESKANQPKLLETLEGDLPITRRKSLQRFLEKRKERLTAALPYNYACKPETRL